ncbi:hypothetical protein FIU24_22665 [Pseudomonas aeruginosa]|nr:hypothetical protein FA030_06930 [Pseudomonas aeruginosa]QDD53431.1 hypothetical protein FIU24_22665 [Pseudomonas aeruginosa]
MKGTARPPTPRPLHTVGFLGKRSAQARMGRRRQGSKPNGRDSQEARGAAREPDGGTPGRHEARSPITLSIYSMIVVLSNHERRSSHFRFGRPGPHPAAACVPRPDRRRP